MASDPLAPFREAKDERERREWLNSPEGGLNADDANLVWHQARRARYKAGDELRPSTEHLAAFLCGFCGEPLAYYDTAGFGRQGFHFWCERPAGEARKNWRAYEAAWQPIMEIQP